MSVDWKRLISPKTAPQLTPELRARIQPSFDEAARDEEHFPSTIDPRIYHVKLIAGSSRRSAPASASRCRLRQRPLRARVPGAAARAPNSGAWISPRRCCSYVPAGIHTRAGSMTELPFDDRVLRRRLRHRILEHAVEIDKAVERNLPRRETRRPHRHHRQKCRTLGPPETPEWEKWFTRKELEGLLRQHCRRSPAASSPIGKTSSRTAFSSPGSPRSSGTLPLLSTLASAS